ncbi:C39 family peptidase [Nitrospira sp. M1]
MKIVFLLLCLVLLSGCMGTLSKTNWSEPQISTVKRHSLKELRDRHVVKQQEDYSCGAAALATLLLYYYGEDTSETEVLKLLKRQIDPEEWPRKSVQGFSLLDLKKVAQTKGFRAAGFELTIEQLAKLTAPVIVFIEPLGYKHFAVLRGVDRGRVYLADPSRGNLRMNVHRFMEEWSGIVFVLGKSGEELLADYPLALPRPEVLNPEIRRVGQMLGLGRTVQQFNLRPFQR